MVNRWKTPTRLLLSLALSAGLHAQTSAYTFRVPVDEVSLTFHAADAHGLPVNGLTLADLSLRDNGQPPGRILAFEPMQNFPIRASILVDTSPSMERSLAANRAIAMEYARQLLRQSTDQAFVMEFGYTASTVQPWTSNPATLAASIGRIRAGKQNPLGGTALFDTIFRACFYEFGKVDHNASGNFILLFTDGEDNASHAGLQQAVDICQRSSTALYAFRTAPQVPYSSGPETLNELTSKTGGRVFFSDDSPGIIDSDLRMIEADLRNQYRLIYSPAKLPHDGQFHRIDLQAKHAENIQVRTGYYAPSH